MRKGRSLLNLNKKLTISGVKFTSSGICFRKSPETQIAYTFLDRLNKWGHYQKAIGTTLHRDWHGYALFRPE